jgi:hypothetical protein
MISVAVEEGDGSRAHRLFRARDRDEGRYRPGGLLSSNE